VLGAVDWSNLTVAGAFIVGAVLAAVAALRMMRFMLGIFEADPRLRRRRRHDDEPE